MPLEIKELLIKATIGDESQENNANSESNANSSDPAMIQAIVEKVLEALQKKGER